ncbi:MAG: L-seryl-tRNA(Sec) selenium transferase [Candidatus Eisenbacteria bacterium]|nr:L-seryl-tRNA(Sec) selenium transferase [Candidatus Eisenbacteria bacterium]
MTDEAEIAREYRELPSVDLLLERLGDAERSRAEAGMEGARTVVDAEGSRSLAGAPRLLVRDWVRRGLEEARSALATARTAAANGDPAELPARGREAWITWVLARVDEFAAERSDGMLQRVVNATGVLLHTNLGRAPLPGSALDAYLQAGTGYCSLEMDLASGQRRSRLAPIRRLLPLLTGAESGIAVHNTAAAVFLTLSALARGREVIVSRAHLVEIGGSFRLPDIMEAAGVRLVEVGATNRTRIGDYEAKIGPDTALLLKVHPSNFKMVGFTEEASTEELAALGAKHGVPFFEDLGSGALRQHGDLTLDEPRVQDTLVAGADIVAFSGDKLLGAPQAGILVGKKSWIDRISKDPVARIVRLDKTALAALERTIELYLGDPAELRARVPMVRMLSEPLEEVEARANSLAADLQSALGSGWRCIVVPSAAEVGGGSLPGQELPSRAVEISGPLSVQELSRRLRSACPPVVGRIEKDRFLLDVRTLLTGDDVDIVNAMEGLR